MFIIDSPHLPNPRSHIDRAFCQAELTHMGSSRGGVLLRPGGRHLGCWEGPSSFLRVPNSRCLQPVPKYVMAGAAGFAGHGTGRGPFSALHLSGELRGWFVRPSPRAGLVPPPVAPPSSGSISHVISDPGCYPVLAPTYRGP